MANDAREIYEAVLGEIKNELNMLVPEYEEKIAMAIIKRLESLISDKATEYDRRINELEQKNRSLEKQISEVQSRLSRTPDTTRSMLQKDYSGSISNERLRECIQDGYQFAGWIYYANEEMGDFLYRVRTDGTGNQQLTDYSVWPDTFSIRNGKLHFMDASFEDRSIDI